MLCNRLVIRPTTGNDREAIRMVEYEAYGRSDEAQLAEELIPAPETTFSFIAECDGMPVGHILLTEISAPVPSLALAPLAVIPAYREMQVGTSLVRKALEEAAGSGFKAIFVIGDPLYYERFGFSAKLAKPFRVHWKGVHFLALELERGILAGHKGKLEYPADFHRA